MSRQLCVGTYVKRKEDPRLLTGNSNYVDDVRIPGLLFCAFVRSPYAHARIRSVNIARALTQKGVVAGFAGKDIQFPMFVPPTLRPMRFDILATSKARYVGDPVALIIATSRAAAEDAAEEVEVDYEVLKPVVDP